MSDPGFVLIASYVLAFLIVINIALFMALRMRIEDLANIAKSRLESYRLGYADGIADAGIVNADVENTYFVSGPEASCFVNGSENVEKVLDAIVEMTDADEDEYTATKVDLVDAIVLTEAYKRRVASDAGGLATTKRGGY